MADPDCSMATFTQRDCVKVALLLWEGPGQAACAAGFGPPPGKA